MAENDLFAGWDWADPERLSASTDEFMAGFTECEKLEPVAAGTPFGRDRLRELGLTGIEFAAFKTQHSAGLGTDLLPLRDPDTTTEPGRIYLVDGQHHFTELDIRRPLPFESGAVDWVYAEHLIEHISLTEGITWLSEVRRILAPGGLLRLTTPDLARYITGYTEGGFYAKHRRRMRYAMPGAPPMPDRRAFMVNQIFYLYGHRWIYDLDELTFALTEAGFAAGAVQTRAFRTGVRQDVAELDQTVRNDETMYVEVTA